MFRFKYVAAILLGTIILGCASEKPQLSVKTSAKKNLFYLLFKFYLMSAGIIFFLIKD